MSMEEYHVVVDGCARMLNLSVVNISNNPTLGCVITHGATSPLSTGSFGITSLFASIDSSIDGMGIYFSTRICLFSLLLL